MVTGVGIDACEVSRIREAVARSPQRFLARTCTPSERVAAAALPASDRSCAVARAFAVKEACFKALGGGWPDDFSFLDVDATGCLQAGGTPVVSVSGRAAVRASELGVTRFACDVTDDGELAVAAVVALSLGTRPA